MENTLSVPIGTKPTDITIELDHDPSGYFAISDKNISKSWGNLDKGSVWRMDGKQYQYDERVNYYIFRRIDYV